MISFLRNAPLLYVPGDRPKLRSDLCRLHDPRPYSVAICLEDSVLSRDRWDAAERVASLPWPMTDSPAPILLRPASRQMLSALTARVPYSCVVGYILPKASLAELLHWLAIVPEGQFVLPIVETPEMLEESRACEFAEACREYGARIPCVRIGANDLLSAIGGLRRPRGRTIYETALAHSIDMLVTVFGIRGVRLTGSVFERFGDDATLMRETQCDAGRGLFGKSAIHPRQLQVIWKGLEPSADDLKEASAILRPDAPAVSANGGAMLEPSCHARWAARVLELNSVARSWDNRRGEDAIEPSSRDGRLHI
jgi:citrate lyase beta subunit